MAYNGGREVARAAHPREQVGHGVDAAPGAGSEVSVSGAIRARRPFAGQDGVPFCRLAGAASLTSSSPFLSRISGRDCSANTCIPRIGTLLAPSGRPCVSKQSTVAALAQDTFEFNRLLLKSDIIEAVVTGDTAPVRDPELLDTSERREAFKRMLPPAVSAQVLSVEGTRVMDASLSPTGMVSALDSTRLLSAFPSELTLSQLQRLAVSSAAVCTSP